MRTLPLAPLLAAAAALCLTSPASAAALAPSASSEEQEQLSPAAVADFYDLVARTGAADGSSLPDPLAFLASLPRDGAAANGAAAAATAAGGRANYHHGLCTFYPAVCWEAMMGNAYKQRRQTRSGHLWAPRFTKKSGFGVRLTR